MIEENRLVEIVDDEGVILLCKTNMSEFEVDQACFQMYEDKEHDDLDYEEKLTKYAEEIGAVFERKYVERYVF